jgi:hypothetical protein
MSSTILSLPPTAVINTLLKGLEIKTIKKHLNQFGFVELKHN